MPRLKVACVQVDPTHGDPAGNMRAADAILARLSHDDALDVLLLPEMAHSGYCFDDPEDVRRVLETDDGPTVRWCAAHARRLRCTLLCGYPRLVTSASGESASETETAFNALVAVGPDGVVLANYHKTFLYVIDKTWATEGHGFTTITLPLRGASMSAEADDAVRATLGICMDINPREFEAPWDAHELARACLDAESSLLLFASAWTNNHPDDDPATITPVDPAEVMTYWLRRLAPLVGSDVHFVCANRVGEERGITFTGCSCVMGLREPTVVAAMGPTDVGVLVAEIDAPTAGELREKRRRRRDAATRGGRATASASGSSGSGSGSSSD
jgi:protein N-terminal amidase